MAQWYIGQTVPGGLPVIYNPLPRHQQSLKATLCTCVISEQSIDLVAATKQ